MDSYIVRIYRYDHAKPRAIVGTVEEAEAESKKAFANMEELWDILNPINKKSLKISTQREQGQKRDLEG